MINNPTPTSDVAAGRNPPLPDPRPLFARAVQTARATIAGVRADQFDAPTPCADFDVRVLTGHLVAVLHRAEVIGAGRSPFEAPAVTVGVPDDGYLEVFDRRAAEAEAVWAAADLADIVTVPWTQMPGVIALMIYTSEVTVHTWDLAVATGQEPAWDGDVVAMSLTAMQRGLPDEGRMESFAELGTAVPFEQVVPVGADAAPIEQLVAWCGRNPANAV